MNKDITRDQRQAWMILPPLMIMIVLWLIGLLFWIRDRNALQLIFFGYSGLVIGAGIGGYIAAADRYRPYARRLVIILMGSLLLAAAFLTDHGNMQLEGFFFALLTGTGGYIILHFIVAKVAGPFIFGRVWCGWACWYAMIFDLLPYPFSHYRRPKSWGYGRYIHFGLSLLIVLVLWFGYGKQFTIGEHAMVWFAIGMLLYMVIGVSMAMILKDNRAFCKYLCPLAVPMKAGTKYALLKVSGVSDHCAGCEVCVEMCPQDIRVKDYIVNQKRVLSTECTLCQTCISACPHDSLTLSIGFDSGDEEFLDFDASRGNRNTSNMNSR